MLQHIHVLVHLSLSLSFSLSLFLSLALSPSLSLSLCVPPLSHPPHFLSLSLDLYICIGLVGIIDAVQGGGTGIHAYTSSLRPYARVA
jgi:hypothetical protein